MIGKKKIYHLTGMEAAHIARIRIHIEENETNGLNFASNYFRELALFYLITNILLLAIYTNLHINYINHSFLICRSEESPLKLES